MKNTKKIINITGMLILAGTIFYFFIKDSADMLNKDIKLSDRPIIRNDIKISENNKIQDKAKNQIKDLSENLYANTVNDSDILVNMSFICGGDSKLIHETFSKLKGLDKLSKVQIKAVNKILEKCDKWYDYIGSLSKEQLELLAKNRTDLEELNMYFNMVKPHSQQMIDEAREVMRMGADSSMVSIGALKNLLLQDYGFIGKIAKKLGTRDLKYITDNSYNIAMLYACEVSPQDCSADSIRTLSLCVEFEYMCGRSYTEYYATTVTSNHFADMMNIVDIIRVLTKQGYFD